MGTCKNLAKVEVVSDMAGLISQMYTVYQESRIFPPKISDAHRLITQAQHIIGIVHIK
jgi:hypothetical protein